MVHDDKPVGLDGVRVEFDDERVGLRRWDHAGRDARGAARDRGVGAASWCGCVATGRARRTRAAR